MPCRANVIAGLPHDRHHAAQRDLHAVQRLQQNTHFTRMMGVHRLHQIALRDALSHRDRCVQRHHNLAPNPKHQHQKQQRARQAKCNSNAIAPSGLTRRMGDGYFGKLGSRRNSRIHPRTMHRVAHMGAGHRIRHRSLVRLCVGFDHLTGNHYKLPSRFMLPPQPFSLQAIGRMLGPEPRALLVLIRQPFYLRTPLFGRQVSSRGRDNAKRTAIRYTGGGRMSAETSRAHRFAQPPLDWTAIPTRRNL